MIGKSNVINHKSTNSALLHVLTTANSTVQFEKGGIVIKVLYPNMGFVDINNSSLAHYYYLIDNLNFGSWTVISTLDNDTTSGTVNISETLMYTIDLSWDGTLYSAGNEFTKYTGGYEFHYESSKVASKQSTYLYLNSSASNGQQISTVSAVDLTKWNTIYFRFNAKFTASNTANNASFMIYSYKKSGTSMYSRTSGYTKAYNLPTTNAGVERSIDISSLTGSYYIVLSSFNDSDYQINRIRLAK